MTPRTARTDAGFTLIEVIAALAVIGVVMTAVTTFFVRSMVRIDYQGSRQAAIQLAADGMERLRQIPGSNAYAFMDSENDNCDNPMLSTPCPITLNGIDYLRTWSCTSATIDPCDTSSLIRLTLTVKWRDPRLANSPVHEACPGGSCEYSATTLISTEDTEPIFDPAAS
jgi:prepilin-type N-terminal cleavage/methylation domain-containing protein